MANYVYQGDIPANLEIKGDIAVDTEAMGLNNHRDRLCVVQFSSGDGDAHLVHFPEAKFHAPHLSKLLSDPNRTKIFHFARFDLAILQQYLGIWATPVFCTKIASRLCRTYTDNHGLKDLCRELLQLKVSKEQQSSYWGAESLTKDQIEYAANDVLFLHNIRTQLETMLKKEERLEIAQKIFDFLPIRAELDLIGWKDLDIFAH